MTSTETTSPKMSAPLISCPHDAAHAHMSAQSKLGKDAPSVVCSAHERGRTQIQRSYARSYAVDPLDDCQQDREHRDPDEDGYCVHAWTMWGGVSRPHYKDTAPHNDFVTAGYSAAKR